MPFLTAIKISERRIFDSEKREERLAHAFGAIRDRKNEQEKREEEKLLGKKSQESLLILVMERGTDDAIKTIAAIRSCIIDATYSRVADPRRVSTVRSLSPKTATVARGETVDSESACRQRR
jgi:hypothetical protein